MPGGHAHVGGGQHVAVLVGHGLGVDESNVLDDLAVLAREPHLPRAARRLHFHTHQAGAADLHVHLGDGDGGAVRSVPRTEVFRVGPHLPDEIHRRIKAALDDNRFLGIVLVSHRVRLSFVVVWSRAR